MEVSGQRRCGKVAARRGGSVLQRRHFCEGSNSGFFDGDGAVESRSGQSFFIAQLRESFSSSSAMERAHGARERFLFLPLLRSGSRRGGFRREAEEGHELGILRIWGLLN
ncbi:hypothetical protein VIGAN_08044000 [Vigna angularis var. angularis]|uniref:Uncharacterized protein n=1 Tax=Vigna angularis var. angularis TaxID=157739 RepID=A0A0S3SM16_PHAAN|nr:hypothetical protein VIGAN_08044000 [Vigna angularis var. angularis]